MLRHEITRQHTRILQISDLHIENTNADARPQRALDHVAVLAKQHSVDLILIVGDLFDNNRVDDETVAVSFQKLSGTLLPVLILPGNHDCLVQGSVYYRKESKSFSNIRIFQKPQGENIHFADLDLAVWGKPIVGYSGKQYPLSISQERSDLRWHIGAAHGYYVMGNRFNHHMLRITEEEVKNSKFDYISLGHDSLFRSVCDDPIAFYCGSASTPGTAALVDLQKSGVSVECQYLF